MLVRLRQIINRYKYRANTVEQRINPIVAKGPKPLAFLFLTYTVILVFTSFAEFRDGVSLY